MTFIPLCERAGFRQVGPGRFAFLSSADLHFADRPRDFQIDGEGGMEIGVPLVSVDLSFHVATSQY